jgi:hypothetical protein
MTQKINSAAGVDGAGRHLYALGGRAAGVDCARQPQQRGVQAAACGGVVAASRTLHGGDCALRSDSNERINARSVPCTCMAGM